VKIKPAMILPQNDFVRDCDNQYMVIPPITKDKTTIVLCAEVSDRNWSRKTATKPLNGLRVCPNNVIPKGQ
jgi:hypothetical protein